MYMITINQQNRPCQPSNQPNHSTSLPTKLTNQPTQHPSIQPANQPLTKPTNSFSQQTAIQPNILTNQPTIYPSSIHTTNQPLTLTTNSTIRPTNQSPDPRPTIQPTNQSSQFNRPTHRSIDKPMNLKKLTSKQLNPNKPKQIKVTSLKVYLHVYLRFSNLITCSDISDEAKTVENIKRERELMAELFSLVQRRSSVVDKLEEDKLR